jgi:hypothetical protein
LVEEIVGAAEKAQSAKFKDQGKLKGQKLQTI